VVGQITRKYRLGKPSGYYPNTSTRKKGRKEKGGVKEEMREKGGREKIKGGKKKKKRGREMGLRG